MISEALDGTVIRSAALRTQGSVGPSGLDAYGWRCDASAPHFNGHLMICVTPRLELLSVCVLPVWILMELMH